MSLLFNKKNYIHIQILNKTSKHSKIFINLELKLDYY